VLVRSLTSQAAQRKTFELISEDRVEQQDLDALFAALDADRIADIDAIRDAANMTRNEEPLAIIRDLEATSP
jgi:hypothetical protein